MLTRDWPDVVFVGDAPRSTLSAAAKRGRLVRLGAGIYSGRPATQPADIVRRNWFQILDHELPGAIITDRCGQRWMPDHDVLTVVHPRQRPLRLPGLTILPRNGLGPLPGDSQRSGIWLASEARALLENVGRDGSRYLSDLEIETWVSDLLSMGGDARLNQVRDAARDLAQTADQKRSFERLDAMIGAALMTRPADALRSAALRAYSLGQPFDHRRVESFEALATRLASVQPAPFPLFDEDEPRRNLLPFYEAYFSNFIEGTEFGIEQAAAIVFDNDIPADRPRDAHDILGTYQIVGDPAEMAVTPSTPHELIQLLQARHRTMLAARPDVRPGLFKERTNQAGSTLFVDPALVEPTLRQGFEVGQTLLGPFARAVYLMFLVSEVHPFDDGNGRIARIMMNAELERAREGRIIIPTVFRNEYLSALKGATHNRNFDSLIDVLSYAQRYAARIDFSSRLNAERDLSKTNAFRDSTEAERTGIRLRLLPPFGQELGPLPLPESVSPR